MSDIVRPGSGNPLLNRRLHQPSSSRQPFYDPVDIRANFPSYTNDGVVGPPPLPAADKQSKPFLDLGARKPARRRAVTASTAKQSVSAPLSPSRLQPLPRRYSKLQLIVFGMACLVFSFGVMLSVQSFLTNRTATKQAAALAKQSDTGSANSPGNGAPSTARPSARAVANYAVAPNLPRYLNIPTLGIHTRVFSLGVLSSGALATPSNIYDAGWYNESSQPGQAGAMLIDGHVANGKAKGVFYNLKNLKPGNQLQIQRGDGKVFMYKVVRSQTYPSGGVDMQSAVTSVVAGKPGLNLITCAGEIKAGTTEFSERIIVYTEQI